METAYSRRNRVNAVTSLTQAALANHEDAREHFLALALRYMELALTNEANDDGSDMIRARITEG